MTADSQLEALRRVCADFSLESLRPRLDAVVETVRTGGLVDLAVLGQFKAGKSSLLNALLGQTVIPVDVLPATSVVTRLGYGGHPRVTVRRLSGEALEVPLSQLAKFVTEKENPENAKEVALVDVELPALAAYAGLRFVDTPGLGSAFVHNTRASLDWLPHVGGALVAVSASHPLSEQDLSLIDEVSRHTPEVAIILTKADLVSEADLAAIVSFTRHQLSRHASRRLPVLPFSIVPAFETLRSRFHDYVRERFVEGREERFGTIVGHKLRTLAAEARSYLDLARAAAAAEETARQDLREALAQERRAGGPLRGEIGVLVRDLKTRARTAASERFHAYHGEVTAELRKGLRNASPKWNGNLADTTRRFQGWLAEALFEELSRVSGRGGESLSRFLDDALAQAHRSVRAFQDRLANQIRRALGVSFEGARFRAEVAEPARPDIRIGKTFDTNIDVLWFAIPMFLVRTWVQRHFVKLVVWEAEKNLSRLAGQWAEAVNACLEGIATQTLGFMERELSTIEAMVSGGSDRQVEIWRALVELEELEHDLTGEMSTS